MHVIMKEREREKGNEIFLYSLRIYFSCYNQHFLFFKFSNRQQSALLAVYLHHFLLFFFFFVCQASSLHSDRSQLRGRLFPLFVEFVEILQSLQNLLASLITAHFLKTSGFYRDKMYFFLYIKIKNNKSTYLPNLE